MQGRDKGKEKKKANEFMLPKALRRIRRDLQIHQEGKQHQKEGGFINK